MVLVPLVNGLIGVLQRYVSSQIGEGIIFDLRRAVFDHLQRQSLRFFTNSKTGAVMFQNERWTFRDVFELAQNSGEFVPEDTVALERLARRFASSLIASVLHAKP